MRRFIAMCLLAFAAWSGAFSEGEAAELPAQNLPVGTLSLPSFEVAHQTLQQKFSFYVYRPSFLPSPWYLTLEGFPVVQLPNGLWVFGYAPNPQKPERCYVTGFVVGSVSPLRLGLAPLAPPFVFPREEGISLPAAGGIPAQAPAPRSVPSWMGDPMFLDMASRKDVVDRMGVLGTLSLPVGWKGENPSMLYIWTGRDWYNLEVRNSESMGDALRRGRYDLVKLANRNTFSWSDWDSAILASTAISWGYAWVGVVPW
ncbi:MAG TPA: hypothetical protein PLW97_09650 [Synergistaceae bacterium]|nr:hypothetical protein [Synergistaceae bacterium]HPQ37893.1 hypothetical protein [Synergistaceae bacterium]